MKNSGSENNIQGRDEPDLSPRERQHYEQLLALRNDLVQQIRALSATSLTSARQAGEELADVGSDDFMRETELTLMTGEGRRLAEIQNAIERMEEGTYGRCTDCGGKISEERLEAIPYTELCIECQSQRESNGGLPPEEP